MLIMRLADRRGLGAVRLSSGMSSGTPWRVGLSVRVPLPGPCAAGLDPGLSGSNEPAGPYDHHSHSIVPGGFDVMS